MGVKLTKVRIKAYRSISHADGMSLPLGSGVNAFVGPNNVGKSNVMRAVALAFGEDIDGFDLAADSPANLRWSRPRVTLDFRVENPTNAEKTLLARANALEREVNGGGPTYADLNRIVLRVKYSAEGRQEYLVTRGAGDRRASETANAKVVEQLHRCVRFVLIRSGEALDDFLRGRFSDVLGNVLAETQGKILDEARVQRATYVDALRHTLLAPVSQRVLEELCELVPEIGSVELVPSVPEIEETIRSAAIRLSDAAPTDLAAKGTGVRGGLLVAMLRYLAEASKRSLVFAVEEPESFLHPKAQEVIRDDLEQLAERSDVTLLVSTHSPLILSRAAAAKHFALQKDESGSTSVGMSVAGDGTHTDVIAGLYSSMLLPQVLEEVASAELPNPCVAIVVVEGVTDVTYLRAAALRAGRSDLLDGFHVIAGGGAKQAAVQAVLWKSRGVSPVLALLDGDEHGKGAKRLLVDDFKFQGPQVLTYERWAKGKDVVAEHLLPEKLFERFFDVNGQEAMAGRYRAPNGQWRFEVRAEYKATFARYVEEEARVDDLTLFIEVLEDLRVAAETGRLPKRRELSGSAE
jgi:putative ATP-dependent endonuclease of the OLD family